VTSTETAVAQEFLTTQVELLESGRTAELAERYAEDAVVVRFDRVAHGRAEVKEFFDYYLTQNPTITRIIGSQIVDNVIVYEAEETLDGRAVTAVGTLVFVNGLVWRQTAVFVRASTIA